MRRKNKLAEKNLKSFFIRGKKHFKIFVIWAVLVSTICWSTYLPSFLEIARAASTIDVSTLNLINGNFPNAPIKVSSNATAIVKISVTASQAGQTLQAVTVNFSGSGFATTTLANIAANFNSGVALYDDTGSGNVGTFAAFGSPDSLIGTSTGWIIGTSNITITPQPAISLSNGVAKIFYAVIKTSAAATNNSTIIATIPANGVVTSDGNGPASQFSANSLKVDTTAPSITSVAGFVGSNSLTVTFSEPVQKINGSNLTASQFTFTDNGTAGSHTISSVSHSLGQNFATLTLSGNLDAGDIDGTPSTLAAVSGYPDAISDMAGNEVPTTPVAVSSPITITTAVVPTATSTAIHGNTNPLVTFAASGGDGSYAWSEVGNILSTLGLSLNSSNGKATGTISNLTGNYLAKIKVTDGASASTTKPFTFNIGNASGVVPGISSIMPGGGAQSSTFIATTTGINSNFTNASSVQFLLNGSNDANVAASSISRTSSTTLRFTITIGAGAALGQRDLKITTGTENVYMPNAFTVFASGSSGLTLLSPSSSATNVPIPPNFNFNPSSQSPNAYRITVKTTSDFSTGTMWDYVFPGASNPSSHCNASSCNIGYGNGMFMVLTPPTFLAPNTTYYWNVRTYTQEPYLIADSVAPLEAASVQSFTTTGSITDSAPPTIMHRPLFQATVSSTLNIFARVMDNIATASSSPALTSKILYCATASCTPSDATGSSTAIYLGGGYFKYTVPSGSMGGSLLRYFLQASDGTNTNNFKAAGDAPFQLSTAAAGAGTISGTVSTSTAPSLLSDAYVFAEGTGFNAITNGSGAFSLSNIPSGTYDIIAFKNGYADRMMNGIPAGATGIAFTLSSGGGGGYGGDMTRPRVKFNGPPDNGVAPGNDTNFKIFVAFDKAMSQNSITGSGNIIIKEYPSGTDITSTKGSIAYYTSPQSGMPSENSLAVWSFTGGNTFGDNKTIAVIVTPSVTDTAGNPIQGNQPDGSYAFSFNTGAMFTGGGGQTFGQGGFMPPHVIGTNPPPGSFDIPRNMKVSVNFSDPMADDGNGYILKDFIKLYAVASGVETDVSSTAISTISLDTAKTNATINLDSGYNSGTLAASTVYRVKVLGGAKSSKNLTIGPPSTNNAMFTAEFKTSATSDTAAPTVVGSFPDNSATGVPVNIGAVNIGFNKDMDISTINTNTFYLSIGSTAVNGSVEYKPMERMAYFIPSSALIASTTYTLNVTTDVKGINGVALTTAIARTFSAGGPDTVVPKVSFMNADDYSVAITFSEPMNAAKVTDTLNWTASVMNKDNYSFTGAATEVPATATFSYDATTNTVIIKGFTLTVGTTLTVAISNVKDLSGNAIGGSNNGASVTVLSSVNTKGALGPMAMGGDSFSSGGGFMPDNFSSGTFGFAPKAEVRPFNTMAGQTTIYGVRIPISKQITAGGTITLTFPAGFDISGAKQDINSPMRGDLNGPGSGTIKFKCNTTVAGGKTCSGSALTGDTASDATVGGLADDGVMVNTGSRTVTITLSADTNSEGHDFLTIDIAGIKNSTVPKDFNTSGYTADIKTMNASALLESLTSMPIFIQSAGANTLSGTITATGNDQAGTMKVYLMSPMTGPVDTTSVDFSDAVSEASDGATKATYSFTNLPNGEFFLFTDQSITVGTKEFTGKNIPERISLSGNATYNFTVGNNATGGTNLTVRIDGPSAEPLDIFAGSQTGFKAKQVTLDSSAGTENFTLNLADGRYSIGVGPQMPKGFSGPPPAPSYLPPKPVEVSVSGATILVNGVSTTTLSFTLTSSDKTIKGIVKDGAGKVMANSEVYAYSPQGGMGTHTQADSAGAFTLNVTAGSYIVGAFIPGMPPSKEVPVVVTNHATIYLLIDGTTTAITPATAATTFILKVAKPDYTISGKVTDGTNVIQGASVYAYRTDGPGHANANTDSSGNYTLYISAGAWKVGSFLPQYGQLTEQTVTISTANASNINFSPSGTGTFYTVSGRVYKDLNSGGTYDSGEELQGIFVRIMGTGGSNETMTGSDGTYSTKVPAGNGYVIKAFAPGIGELPPLPSFNVSGDVTSKDISIGTPNTITFITSSTITNGFIELIATSTNMIGRAQIANGTSTTMSLPSGLYKVKVNLPGMAISESDIAATSGATAYNTITGIVTVNGNESLTVTLPTLLTVSGTVTDGSVIADAWVEIMNPSSGVHFGTKTGTDGTYSLKVASSTTDYIINAMKSGYYRIPTTLTVNGGNKTGQTLIVSSASLTISGQVLIGSSGAANAFVRAEKQGGGFSGTQADANGNYVLPVDAGIWKVLAVAEGYAEAAYASNPITVSTSVSGKNITLTTTVSLDPIKSKPITPSSGGTLEDTTTGVKLTIPANALGSGSSAGNIQAKETNNVRKTSSATPIGDKAQEIKATDSDGNPINTLNDSINVEMSYSTTELATTRSSGDSSINTKTEVDKLQMAYWDETTQNWVTLPTTITYYKSDGTIMDSSDASHTPESDLSNIATTTLSAPTTHLSLYAPISSTGENPPSTPSGLAASAQSTTQINLSWTELSGDNAATSYDIYRSTSADGTYSRLGSEPTVSSGSTVSYSDTGLSASTAYYYKITALNANGESAASSAVSATTNSAPASSPSSGTVFIQPQQQQTATTATITEKAKEIITETKETIEKTVETTKQAARVFANKIVEIASEATEVIKANLNALLNKFGFKRDLAKEDTAVKKYVKSLIKEATNLTKENKDALSNFIAYGTPTTKILGEGERAGVVNSYKSAFGKLPTTEAEWNDAIKIANGRWPSEINRQTETNAETAFKKIYLRKPDRKNPNDDAAIVVMAYGLRPAARNFDSEKAAIKSFKHIYGYNPKSAAAWDIVRAIAYSGAAR